MKASQWLFDLYCLSTVFFAFSFSTLVKADGVALREKLFWEIRGIGMEQDLGTASELVKSLQSQCSHCAVMVESLRGWGLEAAIFFHPQGSWGFGLRYETSQQTSYGGAWKYQSEWAGLTLLPQYRWSWGSFFSGIKLGWLFNRSYQFYVFQNGAKFFEGGGDYRGYLISGEWGGRIGHWFFGFELGWRLLQFRSLRDSQGLTYGTGNTMLEIWSFQGLTAVGFFGWSPSFL